MARSGRERLDHQRELLRERRGDEITDADAEALLEYSFALDDDRASHTYRDADGDRRTYAPRSVETYLKNLRIIAERDGVELIALTPAGINEIVEQLHDDEGLARSTCNGYLVAAKKFVRYHDLGDPDDLATMAEPTTPRHDETDMFSEDEVDRLRRACGQTGWPVRNRAFLELLIFTGQRMSALLTLRVGDVDPGEGYLYLNDDAADLKGATKRGRKRPMFGARKYVRDWLQYHPNGDDPDAWLFIGDPSHWKTDPDDHWSRASADQFLRRLRDAADVDKPCNAHNFRHYCATVLYRDYDLDKDAIRMLLGHSEQSRALEETYTHVFDEDYIRKAEEALGYKEPEERSPFTPETCPTCGELLEDDWRQCPNCQEQFGPTEEIEAELSETASEATDIALTEDLSDSERAAIKAMLDAVDDPTALAESLGNLSN